MTSISFFRSIKVVFLGMAAAQVIPLLGSLIITRLYAPAEFGMFSAWLGVVLMAAIIVTGRLDASLAIVPDGEPRKFAMLATLVTIVAACIILTLALLGGTYSMVPALRAVSPVLLILFVPAVFMAAAIQTWQSWAAAEGQYHNLSWVRIGQALGVTGGQIIIGEWFLPNAMGMASGYILGAVLGLCVAVYLMPLPFSSFKSYSIFWTQLKAFCIHHRRFPLFALPADAMNAASSQLPLLIIASKFGPEASGLYALTVRMLGAPISFLGAALLDVFKRTAATSFREKGHCKEDYFQTFQALAIGSVLLIMGVMFISEPFFVFAFGERWRQAGVIAVWMVPLFALRFIASPLSYTFYLAGKQHIDLIWQSTLLAITLITFLIPSSFEASIKWYVAAYSILYVIYLFLSYYYSKGNAL